MRRAAGAVAECYVCRPIPDISGGPFRAPQEEIRIASPICFGAAAFLPSGSRVRRIGSALARYTKCTLTICLNRAIGNFTVGGGMRTVLLASTVVAAALAHVSTAPAAVQTRPMSGLSASAVALKQDMRELWTDHVV